jgi:hypothetical protein
MGEPRGQFGNPIRGFFSLTIRGLRFYPRLKARWGFQGMNRRKFGRVAVATVALPFSPALAQRVDKYADQITNGEFNWFPERSESGPIITIVSLPDQRVYVYRNGVRIAASSCSTGKLGHATPTGVFKILQKDKNHHSSTYNSASMPYMNRLTWSGIALHAGQLRGYPASHGCVRLPKEFAKLLFGVTKLGMTVVIADDTSQPEEVTHPGMVLGEYAAREFNAVDSAIKATEYSEGHEPVPKSPSVVISSADKSIHVFDDGAVVASGKVEIQDPEKPLGERAFTLNGADDQSGLLSWQAAELRGARKTTGEDNGAALRRIKADLPAREAVRKRLKFGMTIVTTDQPADAKSRSRAGFVVLDSQS